MHDRYLKPPNPVTMEATDEVRSRVADMLREIEVGGRDAVRRYSRDLDGWDADSFVVTDAEFERVSDELDDRLREHIHFAQAQVRRFAQAQRDTLTDLRVEMAPGTVLGHRHIPVSAVGAYVPGGRYPMLASSFMTVCVPRSPGSSASSPARRPSADGGIHPAMLYAMATSGADDVLCLGRRPGTGGTGVRPDRRRAAGRHARRRRQRVRGRGQAAAVRPRRHRSARRPDGDPRHRR